MDLYTKRDCSSARAGLREWVASQLLLTLNGRNTLGAGGRLRMARVSIPACCAAARSHVGAIILNRTHVGHWAVSITARHSRVMYCFASSCMLMILYVLLRHHFCGIESVSCEHEFSRIKMEMRIHSDLTRHDSISSRVTEPLRVVFTYCLSLGH